MAFVLVFLMASAYKDGATLLRVNNLVSHTYIDPELRPFVMDYLDTMMKAGVDVSAISELDSIILVDDSVFICNDSLAIGCADNNKIRIKRELNYLIFGDDYLKVIVYHEMGHAVLKLPHTNFYLHIMYETMLVNVSDYIKYWRYFYRSYLDYYFYCVRFGYLME